MKAFLSSTRQNVSKANTTSYFFAARSGASASRCSIGALFGHAGGDGQVDFSAGQFRGNFAAGDPQTELFDQGPRWPAKSGPKIQDRHLGLEAKNIDETEDEIIVMRPDAALARAESRGEGSEAS